MEYSEQDLPVQHSWSFKKEELKMACPNTMDVKGKLSSWKSYTARYLDIDAKAYHLVLGRRESLRDGQGGGGKTWRQPRWLDQDRRGWKVFDDALAPPPAALRIEWVGVCVMYQSKQTQ